MPRHFDDCVRRGAFGDLTNISVPCFALLFVLRRLSSRIVLRNRRAVNKVCGTHHKHIRCASPVAQTSIVDARASLCAFPYTQCASFTRGLGILFHVETSKPIYTAFHFHACSLSRLRQLHHIYWLLHTACRRSIVDSSQALISKRQIPSQPNVLVALSGPMLCSGVFVSNRTRSAVSAMACHECSDRGSYVLVIVAALCAFDVPTVSAFCPLPDQVERCATPKSLPSPSPNLRNVPVVAPH